VRAFCRYLRGSHIWSRVLVDIYMVLALFEKILILFTWFSPALERFCCYLHGSHFLEADLGGIYMVLALFGEILLVFT